VTKRLVVDHVSKRYHEGGFERTALEDISFEVGDGEFSVIVGPSGCGKTTLLRIIAGLERPSSGRVFLNGKELLHPSPYVSMVFQSFALFPWLTAAQNVEYGLKVRRVPEGERRRRAERYLEMVGLGGFGGYYPRSLSGGMRQRVGFARALAVEPEILLLDEPFSAVDELTAQALRQDLLRIWGYIGATFILVTHNLSEAVELGDKVVVLSKPPAKVRHVEHVQMKRPRRAEDKEFSEIRLRLLHLLGEELGKGLHGLEEAIAMHGRRGGYGLCQV